ncbi:MAG: AroM family protein [Acetothermia bacterium 64_32]|nr:MAG: AroM family protein [Acetothermia bacterium 64_32]HAF71545.1 hypothetical protein [Candidatus Acetothermia bacterium]
MRRLGLITIGQSPRDDVVPELKTLLPKDVTIVEAGALDGLSREEIPPPQAPERTLVTRMSDGTELAVDREFIHPRLEGAVRALEASADLIAYLCSGDLPDFPARVPLLIPYRLLEGYLKAVRFPGPIGLLVPAPAQVKPALEELESWGIPALGQAISPYSQAPKVGEAAAQLARKGAVAILLHCFGFSLAMREQAARASGLPVISVRSLLARALSELLA